ncbi:MAG: peptidase M1 [Bacteroidetes bacterium]|nr:MAG: peptidase M1 [Bacteroidota bacterium]
MKRLLNIITLLLVANSTAQNVDAIAEAETKVALNRVNFVRNVNTGNYDLKYHRLELDIDPSVSFISGDVTAYFEAKENLNQVTFELDQTLTVSQVMQRGNSLSFVQNGNDEIVITLAQVQNNGVLDSLTISYSGNPQSSGLGSFEQNMHNGDPIIWTLSEPYGAKGWWPCKQDLIDKIDSVDVFIKTPQFNPSTEEYFAVSNGLELSQTIDGSDKITRFKHKYPIPAYLIAIAATNYETYSHNVPNNGNPFDIVNYVYPESSAQAQIDTPITVNIMNLFTNLFEEYPFADEKYGHAQFGWSGGMEHTTVSFMGSFNRNLVAHELAHQWFGNKITCGSWKDIWLNEGFATYLSGLVVENLDGNAAFKSWKQTRNNSITSATSGAIYLTDADTTNVGRIFNSRLSYNKGSMVLHMLRKKLGDTDFFQGMKDYLADANFAYDYAKTEDYKVKMETASGENLTEFFDDWVYNQGYPSYTVEWSLPSANIISFKLNQTQSHPSVSFFEAPVTIRIHGTGGEMQDEILNHILDGETFDRSVTFDVASIEFDPEADLISKDNNIVLGTDDVLFELEVRLIPNPASNLVTIKKPDHLSIHKMTIYNMLGQTVLELSAAGNIDVSKLSSGLHFVKFETNLGTFHKSLLKQ